MKVLAVNERAEHLYRRLGFVATGRGDSAASDNPVMRSPHCCESRHREFENGGRL
jgi:hypothetical protein